MTLSAGEAPYACGMDEGAEAITVNFGRAMPLFPLGGVTLLPQAVAPLHIFEPRYVQMTTRALDSDGLIVMAVLDRTGWDPEGLGDPPIRPAVCVGRIAQHHLLPDGRFNILLQGVCRARVVEHVPADGETLFRQGVLEPAEVEVDADEALETARVELHEMFTREPMAGLCAAESVAGALESADAPTQALLELITMSVVSDEDVRYALLEEGRADARAGILLAELRRLKTVLDRARPQRELHLDVPRGVWLN